MEVLSICLSDIPASDRKKAENGKVYCNIVVQKMKQIDAYENDLTVYMGQSKEQRDLNEAKTYIGKGRTYEYTGTKPVSAEDIQTAPMATEEDLPF